MTDREADLLEIVGTHGWRALRDEAEFWLESQTARPLAESQDEMDFVRKEVAAGVIREFRQFFSHVEQMVERAAKRAD